MWTLWLCSAFEAALAPGPPLVTALITRLWKLGGMPSDLSSAASWPVSLESTTAPSTATPITAPSWRLVFVADAAMPERSGWTTGPAAGDRQGPPEGAEARMRPERRTRGEDAAGGEQAAEDHGGPRADASHPRTGQGRAEDERHRHGEEVDRGLVGRLCRHHLHVEGGEEEDGE